MGRSFIPAVDGQRRTHPKQSSVTNGSGHRLHMDIDAVAAWLAVGSRFVAIVTACHRRRALVAACTCAIALAVSIESQAKDDSGGWSDYRTATAAELSTLPLEDLLDLEISAASRYPQRASDAPSAVRIIEATEILAHGWSTLGDALASLPGLYVTDDRSYTYLGARGFLRPGDYNSRFLLLVDGVRLNDPIYGQATIGTDFPIDVDQIERIEYAPGPGSAVYGSNAYFGVINVVTRWAGATPLREASVELGSAGVRGLSATYGARTESGTDLLVAVSDRRREGRDLYYAEFDDEESDGVAHDLDGEKVRSLLLKARHGDFNLVLSHGHRDKETPTASYEQLFDAPGSYVHDAHTFLDVGYTHRVNSTMDMTGNLSYGEFVYRGDYLYGPPLLINRDKVEAAWLVSNWKLVTTALDRHTLAVGIDLQRDLDRDQLNFDVDPEAIYLDSRRTGTRVGVFAEDEFAFTPNLLLNAGLRFDRDSESGSDLSPRLALIKRGERTTYKAMFGKAFRSPNDYEMFYETAGEGGQMPNPHLRSERIGTAELMVTHQLDTSSALDILAYRYELSDLISQVRDETTGQLIFRNTDEADATGVEIAYARRWSNGASLRASYAHADVSAATGETPTNSPRHLVKLNALLPIWNDRALLGIEARHVDRRDAMIAPVPSYTLLNLSVTLPRLTENLELRAGIENVFDKAYFDPVGPEFRQNAIEQDGRNFLVELSYRF
jgi:outer membrane receptor protein involved in Fe transport